MNTIYVIIAVCSLSVPREQCDQHTASSYQAFVAPPGNIVCGVSALTTALSREAENQPQADEYLRISCGRKH
jgi:hypothetical protein